MIKYYVSNIGSCLQYIKKNNDRTFTLITSSGIYTSENFTIVAHKFFIEVDEDLEKLLLSSDKETKDLALNIIQTLKLNRI